MHYFDFLLIFLVCGAETQEEDESQEEPRCLQLEQKMTSGRVHSMRHILSWAALLTAGLTASRLQGKICMFQVIGNMTRNVTCDEFQAQYLYSLAMMQKIASFLLPSFIDYSF